MALRTGGQIGQELHPNPYRCDTWMPDIHGRVSVHIVSGEQYQELVAELLLPPRIDAASYIASSLPLVWPLR
jgi:hypothetical protein